MVAKKKTKPKSKENARKNTELPDAALEAVAGGADGSVRPALTVRQGTVAGGALIPAVQNLPTGKH